MTKTQNITPTVRLKKGKDASLSRFHPWVFSGAIATMPENVAEGDVVRVVDHNNVTLGYGDWQIGSIVVRMLTFGDAYPDNALLSRRIEDAINMRLKLGLYRSDNNTFRIVHGEGDFLPGLIIDLYADTAVVQAHSAGMHHRRNEIANILTANKLININNIYYKSEATLPFKANLNATDGYLAGEDNNAVVKENGLLFNIDWLKGQKTGFFIDQRENRQLLKQMSEGKSVLNMFCYTGGFSVYALKGGAERVTSVDSSAKAIHLTEKNVEINFGADAPHKAVAEDAFKFLADMPNEAYNLIILDPPAFAKHRDAINNALRGYQRLNAKAIEKIAPGGILFTFSCSQAITKEQFRLAVFSAAAETKRKVKILHQLTQPADHPVNIYHPEGEYLKGLVLYIE